MKLVPQEPLRTGLPLNQVYDVEIKSTIPHKDRPIFSCRVPLTVHISALLKKAKNKWKVEAEYVAYCGRRNIELHPAHTLQHYGMGPGDTVLLHCSAVKDDMDHEEKDIVSRPDDSVATVLGERPPSSNGAHVLPWQILDLNAVHQRWAVATAQLVLQETHGYRLEPGQIDAKTVYDQLIERGEIGAAFTLLSQLRHFSANPSDDSEAATSPQLMDLLRRIAPFFFSNPAAVFDQWFSHIDAAMCSGMAAGFRSPRGTNRWYSVTQANCGVEAWSSVDWIVERVYDNPPNCALMVEGVQCLLHLHSLLPNTIGRLEGVQCVLHPNCLHPSIICRFAPKLIALSQVW
jgi:hypothetical protein